MRFLTGPVRVRVPATSANLGPGFDSLGLALSLYDEVSALVTGDGVRVNVEGEGAGELPTGDDHLVVAAMMRAFDLIGGRPGGLALRCRNRIPQARGLGSSSAAIVAGVLLARALVPDGAHRLDDRAALRLATEIEGHPDNVAPCLLGGFTIAWTDPAGDGQAEQVTAVRPAAMPGVRPVIFVPPSRGLTAQARAALPEAVPHRDAAFNTARAALLVHALTTEPRYLFAATEDRLHQNYRSAAMPETAALVSRLRGAGVPAVVSGAGPSVLALLADDDGPDLGPLGEMIPDEWCAMSLGVAQEGAVTMVIEHAEGEPVAAGLPS